MMMAKLYVVTWIVLAAAALSAYTTGTLSPIKLTVFGFLGLTLLFIGLKDLAPFLRDRRYESKQLNAGTKKYK